MNRRFSWVFLLASGAFFLFIVGLTGYRTEDTRRHNAAAARESAASLAAKVHSLGDTTGSVTSPLFKNALRSVFDGDPRLLMLSLHSPADGFLYFISRSSTALKEPAAITPGWRGTPSYRVNRGSEVLVTTSLDSTLPGMTMDGLFIVMGKEDLYPIVRDDLYFFLAFLLVCGVAILIVMGIETDAGAAGSRPRPSAASSAVGQSAVGQSAAASVSQGWRPSEAAREPTPAAETRPGREAGPSSRPGLTSPQTGLGWADYLEPRLKAELERAASSDADISFALVRIDEASVDSRLPAVYAQVAGILKESFPLRDLIFEEGEDSYCLILPELDVDAAVRQLDDVRSRLTDRPVEGRNRTVSVGVASRGGRLIDQDVLREEAQVAVTKAAREGGNQVVGFRADAARFRETLTGRVS